MDTAAVEIRVATAGDYRLLARHRVAMFRDMGELQAPVEVRLLDASAAYFATALPAGEYSAWLACDAAGAVVGGAGVQRRTLLPRPAQGGAALLLGLEGVVLNVYVEREWRRRGVARALMRTIIDWAQTAGIVRLVLHPSPDGRPLYESMGFVPTNELRFAQPLTLHPPLP